MYLFCCLKFNFFVSTLRRAKHMCNLGASNTMGDVEESGADLLLQESFFCSVAEKMWRFGDN